MVDQNYSRDRRRKKRLKFIEMLGGKCVSCGSTKNLEFDHINSDDKSLQISRHLNNQDDIIQPELNKIQLLCSKCHKTKTKDKNDYALPPAQHGSITMYKSYGCRCPECKQASQDYYQWQKVKKQAYAR